MKSIRSLITVILIVFVLIILVIVRSTKQNIFKQDVKTALDAAQNKSNLVSLDQLKKQSTPWLVVNLGNEDLPDNLHFEKSMHLPFENLLDQTNREILEEAKGDLILYSADDATAAKAWVILNQLGFKNIFILNTNENSGILNYKFQPDTTARIEPDSM